MIPLKNLARKGLSFINAPFLCESAYNHIPLVITCGITLPKYDM